jgi:hypothetical protein
VSTATQLPAARLRDAADLIDTRAAAASGPTWQPEYDYRTHRRVQGVWVDCGAGSAGCDGVDCLEGTHGIGGFEGDADNRWAILVGPQMGPALAAWLRSTANVIDVQSGKYADPTEPQTVAWVSSLNRDALNVADAILAAEATQ